MEKGAGHQPLQPALMTNKAPRDPRPPAPHGNQGLWAVAMDVSQQQGNPTA